MESLGTIKGWLKAQEPRLVELLERLVTTESHTADPVGVGRVAATVIAELEPLDFHFESAAPASMTASDQWLEELFSPGVSYAELGSTYAGSAPGAAPGRLLLLGDLDTAFPVGTIETFPFRIEDGRAYGPGIADMKGGLVVMVAALQALHHLGIDRPEISIVLAGDEQAGSLASRPVIERMAQDADWCLCVECARRGGKLMAARGHIGVGSVVIEGIEAHTGSARDAGVDALHALARLVVGFDALSDPAAGTIVTVTLARGGRRRSVVAASAHGIIDIRTRAEDQWNTVISQMQDLASRVSSETGAVIDLRTYCHRPGVLWDAGTDRLLGLAKGVGKDLGLEIDAFESAAAGSSAFRSPGTATLDGLGPEGGGLMTFDEHIVLDSVVPRAALLAGTVAKLGQAALRGM